MTSIAKPRMSQADRILALLRERAPAWVPAPELARISLQYASRVYELRSRGHVIENRVERRRDDGLLEGFYRLGARRVSLPHRNQGTPVIEQQSAEAMDLFDRLRPDPGYPD